MAKAAVPVTFAFISKEDCKRTSINSKHNLGAAKGVSALWTAQETPEKARWSKCHSGLTEGQGSAQKLLIGS